MLDQKTRSVIALQLGLPLGVAPELLRILGPGSQVELALLQEAVRRWSSPPAEISLLESVENAAKQIPGAGEFTNLGTEKMPYCSFAFDAGPYRMHIAMGWQPIERSIDIVEKWIEKNLIEDYAGTIPVVQIVCDYATIGIGWTPTEALSMIHGLHARDRRSEWNAQNLEPGELLVPELEIETCRLLGAWHPLWQPNQAFMEYVDSLTPKP